MKPSLSFSASLRLCASLLLASSLHAQFAPVKINATNGALFAPGFTAAQILASNNVPTNGAPLTNFSGTLPWANISGQPSFNLVATNTNATILTNGSSITNLSGLPDTVTNVANYVTNGTLTNVSNALSLQIGTNATNLFTLSNSLVSATNTLQAGITSNATVITSVSNSLTNYTPSSGLNTVAINTNATIPTNGGTNYTLGLNSNSTYAGTNLTSYATTSTVTAVSNSLVPQTLLLSTFQNTNSTLQICTSTNYGTTWNEEFQGLVLFNGTTVRDPSIFYTNGNYYVAATANGYTGTYFQVLQSVDLKTWSLVTNISGIPGNAHAWAPEWVFETNGNIHIFVSCTTNTNDLGNQIYETHPTVSNNFAAAWSTLTNVAPVETNMIDPYVIVTNGVYNLFFKEEGLWTIGVATSTNILGPYTLQQTNLFYANEAPCVYHLPNGQYRLFMAASGGYLQYVDTTNGLTAWGTNIVPCGQSLNINHGTVIPLPSQASVAISAGLVSSTNGALNGTNVTAPQQVAASDISVVTRLLADLEPITGYTTIALPVATASTSASGGVGASVDNAGFITFSGASTSPVGSYGMVNISRPEQSFPSCLNRIARKWIFYCGSDATNNNAMAYFIGGNPSGGSNPVLTSDGLAASWSLSGVVVLQAKINGSSVQSVTNTNSIIGQFLDPGTDYTLTWNGTNTLQLWVARYSGQNYVRPAVIATLITTNNASTDQLGDGQDHVIKYFTATNSTTINDHLGNIRSFFY